MNSRNFLCVSFVLVTALVLLSTFAAASCKSNDDCDAHSYCSTTSLDCKPLSLDVRKNSLTNDFDCGGIVTNKPPGSSFAIQSCKVNVQCPAGYECGIRDNHCKCYVPVTTSSAAVSVNVPASGLFSRASAYSPVELNGLASALLSGHVATVVNLGNTQGLYFVLSPEQISRVLSVSKRVDAPVSTSIPAATTAKTPTPATPSMAPVGVSASSSASNGVSVSSGSACTVEQALAFEMAWKGMPAAKDCQDGVRDGKAGTAFYGPGNPVFNACLIVVPAPDSCGPAARAN